jgi:hypothetical protein
VKKMLSGQQNLFDVPTTGAKVGLPQDVQTAPLKPLVQALLTDLIAAHRLAAAIPNPEG